MSALFCNQNHILNLPFFIGLLILRFNIDPTFLFGSKQHHIEIALAQEREHFAIASHHLEIIAQLLFYDTIVLNQVQRVTLQSAIHDSFGM